LKQFAFSHGYTISQIDYESSLSLYVVALLSHMKVNCVFDVGAHCGEFGAELRRCGYTGHIVSFEPVRDTFALLQQRCARDPRWTAYNVALGAQESTESINVTKTTEFSSFRATTEFAVRRFPDSATVRSEEVAVKRLDDIFQECLATIPNPRVYLKLDTQGWDLEVVKGATGCLESVCALQSEMSVVPVYDGMPSYLEAIASFNQLGFQLSAMYSVSRDANLRLIEFDCVMVKAGAPQLVRSGVGTGTSAVQ
jgi:FkbM family methyltransferase